MKRETAIGCLMVLLALPAGPLTARAADTRESAGDIARERWLRRRQLRSQEQREIQRRKERDQRLAEEARRYREHLAAQYAEAADTNAAAPDPEPVDSGEEPPTDPVTAADQFVQQMIRNSALTEADRLGFQQGEGSLIKAIYLCSYTSRAGIDFTERYYTVSLAELSTGDWKVVDAGLARPDANQPVVNQWESLARHVDRQTDSAAIPEADTDAPPAPQDPSH